MKFYVQFERGQEDRVSKSYGPYDWFQMTYGALRAGEDGEIYIARIDGGSGLWVTEDGLEWSDFVICDKQNNLDPY